MTERGVIEAFKACERFKDLADKLLGDVGNHNAWPPVGTALSGEVRRASMDLTRKLAEMRKGL